LIAAVVFVSWHTMTKAWNYALLFAGRIDAPDARPTFMTFEVTGVMNAAIEV
jgi:hypothetical protein